MNSPRTSRLARLLASQQEPPVLKMAMSPEYSVVHSSRRIALSEEDYETAMEKFYDDLPFTNLFGRGVTRLVVPMINTTKYEILELLKEHGYKSVDWQTGKAIKTTQPGPKAPPGTKPRDDQINIGKALGRIPEGKELLTWWERNSDAAKTDDFSIVVSRHPVDVLRMSDHAGWTSCHTPGREHYASCIGEMKHGGLVAYLVNTDHLNDFTPEQIAGNGEIFEDEKRDIDGVSPVSRLRLRRFTHRDGDFDLALPEDDIYGQRSTEFVEQVMDWARKVQEPVVGEHRWRMNDFIRRGGAYRNSGVQDAEWFNNFFNDRVEVGDTDFGVAGEEDQNDNETINNERRAEMDRISREWNRRFSDCYCDWEEQDEDEGIVYFSWSGGVKVEIADIIDQGSAQYIRREVDRGDLGTHLSNYGIEIGEGNISFSYHSGTGFFDIGVHDPDGGYGGPDEFQYYCDSVLDDNFERESEKLEEAIQMWLSENGYVRRKPVEEYEVEDPVFDHFSIDFTDNEMHASVEESIGDFIPELWDQREFKATANPAIRSFVAREIQKVINIQKQKQLHLKGFQVYVSGTPNPEEAYNLRHFMLNLDQKYGEIQLEIYFTADEDTDEEDMEEIKSLLNMLDHIFPRIIIECGVILENFYSLQRRKRREQFDPEDQGFQLDPELEQP